MGGGAFTRTSFVRGPNRATTGCRRPEAWSVRTVLSAPSRMTVVAEK